MKILKEHEIEQATPFLRWAGGKTWLVKRIALMLKGHRYNVYHEPFLGGGSLFFELKPDKAYLSDLNAALISTYEEVKDNLPNVLKYLRNFENTEECYYKVRASKYRSRARSAAQLIYLNQTSFNGIYRVNLKGEYNVPFGYRKKIFYDPDNLKAVSSALKGVNLFSGDFELVKNHIKKGDLFFLDPPYTVSHNNNGFIRYNHKLFSLMDQFRLTHLIDSIKAKGAYYILTNAAHHKIKEIFDKNDSLITVERPSLIGGISACRGIVEELIFTNL